MWRAIGTSVIGTSHQKLKKPCQDACEYYASILGFERALLIGIADGAGSANCSEIGSKEAVAHLLREISKWKLGLTHVNEQTAAGWLLSTREHLETVGDSNGIGVTDLACTVMFAILADSCSIFGQVGDGGWIAKSNGNYETPTWPSGGEYANQTTFITSPKWREAMQFNVLRKPLSEVAGFTDGLQNVALHFASRSVHAPFFDSKLEALRRTDDETSLRAPLIEFLASPSLCERTDDDKTLVLAWRSEVMLLADAAR